MSQHAGLALPWLCNRNGNVYTSGGILSVQQNEVTGKLPTGTWILLAHECQWLKNNVSVLPVLQHFLTPSTYRMFSRIATISWNFSLLWGICCPFYDKPLLWQTWWVCHDNNNNQCDHLSGKLGNVTEFETCQGNVREKILSGKSVPKLLITSWIFALNSIFFCSLRSQTCTPILLRGASKPLFFAFIV